MLMACCRVIQQEKMGNGLRVMAEIPDPKRSLPLRSFHHLNPHNSNNNNNTEITEEAYPRTHQDSKNPQSTSKPGDLKKPVSSDGAHALEDAHIPSGTGTTKEGETVLQQEWQLEVLSAGEERRTPSSTSRSIQCRRNVFERWAALGHESEASSSLGRPTAKRQLSAESAQTFRVVKKSTVMQGPRREMVSPAQGRDRAALIPRTVALKKKSRKELFSSPEVFRKVDAHALSTGKELRAQGIYSVQKIGQTITQGAVSDLERVRAVWTWLCHNIEYDVSGYLGLSEKLCSPEHVIKAGKGVCCGYSSICLQMCSEVGIECREISGHGKGIGYRVGQSYQNTKSNHMWNAVRLGGQWFLLDACWGAGTVDIESKTFMPRYDEFYFLPDPEDFIDTHCPDEPQWQLLDHPVPLEEFERRVFKTSEFYRMGLTVLYPKHSHLLTVNGEATVSLGCRRPLDFTYQISQQSGVITQDVSSSFGLLTISRMGMKLKLIPPACGIYDVKIFSRPANTAGTFHWVCSFQLECPEPQPSEELPENPFLSWGLQQNAQALGLKECSHGAEPIMLENGSFELVVRTSKPLMLLCELVHKDLDTCLAKRCLATQIELDRLTCHVLCPYRGYYRLSVFVRDFNRREDPFQNVGNFLLKCTGSGINLNELFPPALSTSCGPGIKTAQAGISKFSHTGAIINTQQGKCNITFHNSRDLELHAVLVKEPLKTSGHPLSRHVLFTQTDCKVTVSVSLPEAGIYKLGLYAKTDSSQDFSHLCDYVLRCTSENRWPPFPSTYSAWRKGCVLFEPRAGMLEPLSRVRFRVRCPGAHSICVVGESQTDLQLNKSRVWEGEVFTGSAVPELKLAGKFKSESSDMEVILSFSLLNNQNEL
nr:PREDICTED: kyphoscoliosis peptidase-like isoform X1 [Lepisosteus oculatus]